MAFVLFVNIRKGTLTKLYSRSAASTEWKRSHLTPTQYAPKIALSLHNVYRFHSAVPIKVDTETIIRAWCAIVNSVRSSEEILENEILSLYIREGSVGYRALLNTFPIVVLRSTALLSDGYAIFCSASDRNVIFWSKKPPHSKQEIEHNPRHVTIRAATTSLYLIR
jgi:hypothetical protein